MATKNKLVLVKYLCTSCGYLFRDMENVPVPKSVICPDCGKELHGTRIETGNNPMLWFEYR